MKKILLLVLLLLLPALAQEGQEEFLRNLRNDGKGGDAAVWERVVTVKAGPEFWTWANGPGQRDMRTLAYGIARGLSAMSNALGTGDANEVLGQMKKDATAPPFLAVIDAWKGKYAVNIDLTNWVPDKGQQQIGNLQGLTTTMANPAYLKPRGGKLTMNISFDPKAKDFGGKVSKDGNTYDLVFPIYAGNMSNWKFEELLKKGTK